MKQYKGWRDGYETGLKKVGIMQTGIISIIKSYCDQWVDLSLLDWFIKHASDINIDDYGQIDNLDDYDEKEIEMFTSIIPGKISPLDKMDIILSSKIMCGFGEIKLFMEDGPIVVHDNCEDYLQFASNSKVIPKRTINKFRLKRSPLVWELFKKIDNFVTHYGEDFSYLDNVEITECRGGLLIIKVSVDYT